MCSRHALGHRAGRIDHPRIRRVLEPERDHVVLAVRRPIDDRAEHLVLAEPELAERAIDEQLEAVAVVPAAGERLLERRPVA